jgi:putative hydrolase of the HAD superfamily
MKALVVLALLLVPLASPANANTPRRAVIFDLDDTLIVNQVFFQRAYEQLERLAKDAGLDPVVARNRAETIDASRVKSHGFSRERYPGSLELAILELSGDAALAARAKAIGRTVFDGRARLYPNAKRVLAAYRDLGWRIIVLTKGDPMVQRRRVSDAGLGSLVDHVEVVNDKSADSYRALIARFGLDRANTFVIGNSFVADIATAHAAGIPTRNTVWLDGRPIWARELANLPVDARRRTSLASSLLRAKTRTLDVARTPSSSGGRRAWTAASRRGGATRAHR